MDQEGGVDYSGKPGVGKNYWIGAIVDEKDDIDEAIEWNNATYIPIHVN